MPPLGPPLAALSSITRLSIHLLHAIDRSSCKVISCIKLSIERELKVSDAVPIWLKKNMRAAEDKHETAPVPTEKDFWSLKRKDEKTALDTDTVAVMLHHAFFLVLPCQPFSFHFTWGRFMRFYHETGLNE